MNNHELNSEQSSNFDSMMEMNLIEPPSDIITRRISPWKKSMNRILIGFALTSITFEFLNLNYILPMIGLILTVLGFRTLRNENIWFKGCWIVSIFKTIFTISGLILNANISRNEILNSPIFKICNILFIILSILSMLFFWIGIVAVRKKVNQPPHSLSAFALMIWYLIIVILSSLDYNNDVIFYIMIISYILLLYSLFTLSKNLDNLGFAVKIPEIKIPDWSIVFIFTAILAIGISCGYLFFNKYPIKWEPHHISEDAKIKEIKNHLIDIGFPKNILNDLTDEDIKACEGASHVFIEEYDDPINPTSHESEEIPNSTIYDFYELHITNIGLEFQDKPDTYKIFHHFIWNVNLGFPGNECIRLFPHDYKESSISNITGQILYDLDERTYSSPYYSLTNEESDITPNFMTNHNYIATFSMPNKGKNHRGYLSYLTHDNYNTIIHSEIIYTHQKSIKQYPVPIITGSFSLFENDIFINKQNSILIQIPR